MSNLASPARKSGPVVHVDCPRCNGEGKGHWQPDFGICYLCKGRQVLKVDVARSERHLAFLRGEWVRRARNLNEALAAGEDVSMLREGLAYLGEKGQNRLHLHTLALYELDLIRAQEAAKKAA